MNSQQPSELTLADTPNVDDTIVLSDLVQRGEASRLRRRGAMRLEHTYGTHAAPQTYPLLVVDSYDSQSDPTQPGRLSRVQKNEPTYVLFCGGHEDDDGPLLHQSSTPYKPSILPLFPDDDAPTHFPYTKPLGPQQQLTNGCGAVVHLRASPKDKMDMWVAKTSPSDIVAPLDCEFPADATSSTRALVTSPCGCVREAIACTACGNLLGTRYKPCRTASVHIFPPHRVKTRLAAAPYGMDYFCPAQPSPYVYTFFAGAVTPSPAHEFPHHPRNHHRPSSPISRDAPLIDRYLTASPLPMSDDDESVELAQLDSDSVLRDSDAPLSIGRETNENGPLGSASGSSRRSVAPTAGLGRRRSGEDGLGNSGSWVSQLEIVDPDPDNTCI
ncbi:hypothetical protein FISHEDRAFT_55894 [Fistulina hepatica ATCC 64428]|uniref:Uncharacterized protein n=1 Tax=Fistulina hepatica ATCC 64428 TaxID=1128425 RepID=A0A0D7AM53_9AGAR|nr:hypothetical protein FISHEDRAFT_55894 [Fistulina hepatica ATCC 64428]